MFILRVLSIGVLFGLLNACSDQSADQKVNKDNTNIKLQGEINVSSNASEIAVQNQDIADQAGNSSYKYDYNLLRKKIYVGNATITDIKQALTEDDPYNLTNTIHALYTMRWHRGVHNLLDDLWQNNIKKHPTLAWEHISQAPARIALASTINRNKIVRTDEQIEYIRSYKSDKHEFTRAQSVISLGFNGDPQDIEYLKSMVEADNHYVAQTSITSLALMGGNQAKDAMVELWEKNSENEKGELLATLLEKYYDWTSPSTENIN